MSNLTVMVVCNDDRNDTWIQLLFSKVANLYMVKASQVRHFALNDFKGRALPFRRLPEFVDAILVHHSDMKILNNLPIESRYIFEFNTPGNSHRQPNAIPIYRQTFPQFTITPSDIDELIAFLSGQRPELPAMCEPVYTPDLLPALLLLCQQHQELIREDGPASIVNQPKWWLDSLGLLEHDDLNQGAYQTALKCLQEEWQRSKRPGISRIDVDRLLAQLATEQPTGFAITPSDVTCQVVINAYKSLQGIVGLPTEDQNLRPLDNITELPPAILAIAGSYLTAASAQILALRFKSQQPAIERHLLNLQDLDNFSKDLRNATLILTASQIAHLPTLRTQDFAGPVLVLALDSFSDLKGTHRVLRFGQGSHAALTLPFSRNALLNIASDLVPMQPENLRYFQNEMRAISQIYQQRIVPYLQKLEQADQDTALLNEVANVIQELRAQTPFACHTLVTIENEHLQIQQHLRKALANLEAQQEPQSAVAYLKTAFAQWYQLVKSAAGERLKLAS